MAKLNVVEAEKRSAIASLHPSTDDNPEKPLARWTYN
jgi:hypothetical protein